MARFAHLPDQAYLLECLDYDSETGAFRWRYRPRHHFKSDRYWNAWNAKNSGKTAGTIDSKRRVGVTIEIDSKGYRAHRIAYKMIKGTDPPNLVDHENRQPTDNRWINLRAANRNQNMHNRGINKNNRTGLKGVHLSPSRKARPYVASIMVDNEQITLGYYATKEEAHAVYCAAAKEHFGEFWCAG